MTNSIAAPAELPQLRTPGYDDGIVKLFVIASMA